jgi:hypothetical protein
MLSPADLKFKDDPVDAQVEHEVAPSSRRGVQPSILCPLEPVVVEITHEVSFRHSNYPRGQLPSSLQNASAFDQKAHTILSG